MPWWDAFPTATSVVGQWLLGRKYVENWPAWIVVDVVGVGAVRVQGAVADDAPLRRVRRDVVRRLAQLAAQGSGAGRHERGAFVVALLGAESTGKTTLARDIGAALAARGLRVEVVGEVLREFCDTHARTPRRDEQAAIAAAQTRAHRRRGGAARTSSSPTRPR